LEDRKAKGSKLFSGDYQKHFNIYSPANATCIHQIHFSMLLQCYFTLRESKVSELLSVPMENIRSQTYWH
jgi:hypothetical protein